MKNSSGLDNCTALLGFMILPLMRRRFESQSRVLFHYTTRLPTHDLGFQWSQLTITHEVNTNFFGQSAFLPIRIYCNRIAPPSTTRCGVIMARITRSDTLAALSVFNSLTLVSNWVDSTV